MKKIKVLYDHQIFSNQQYGGISRIFYDLINSYTAEDDVEVDLGFELTANFYLHDNERLKEQFKYGLPPSNEFLPGINFRGKGRLAKIFQKKPFNIYKAGKLVSTEKILKGDFDILHPTYYDPYFLDSIGGKPYVITVYDMIHELYAEYMHGSDKTLMLKKHKVVENAAHVITISDQTKRELIEITNIDPDKVTTVYLNNTLGIEPLDETIEFPEKFLLYVGQRWNYKNFSLFLEVFAALVKKHPDLKLVTVGGIPLTQDEVEFIHALGIQNSFVNLNGKDSIIRAAYKKALAFVYPSIAEGFGIPILEAMDLDCPVICSDIECFRESGGDAPEYFKPKSWKSIYSTIDSVVSDEKLRFEMIRKGKAQAKKFSSERLKNETLEVYKKVFEENN